MVNDCWFIGRIHYFCETEDRLLFLKPFEMSFSRSFWQHLYIAWNVRIYSETLSTNLVIICAGSPSMFCGGYSKEEVHFEHTGFLISVTVTEESMNYCRRVQYSGILCDSRHFVAQIDTQGSGFHARVLELPHVVCRVRRVVASTIMTFLE